jgi:hypothetical protein
MGAFISFVFGLFIGSVFGALAGYSYAKSRCKNGEIGMPTWARDTLKDIKERLK